MLSANSIVADLPPQIGAVSSFGIWARSFSDGMAGLRADQRRVR